MAFALYFVATNSDVDKKVYEEIQSVLGDKNLDGSNMAGLVYVFMNFQCKVDKLATLRNDTIEFHIPHKTSNEPRHEKTCFCHMRTTNAPISLRVRTV